MKNIGWLAISQGVRLVLGLFIGTWLTRTLGPELNGIVGTAAVTVTLAGFVADFGLRQVLIKVFTTEHERSAVVFGTAVRLLFLSGVVMLGVAGLCCWLLGGEQMLMIGLLLACPLSLNGGLAVMSRWDAAQQSHRTAKLALGASIGGNILRAACIYYGAGLGMVALALGFETLFTGAAAFAWAKRAGWLQELRYWDGNTARGLLKEALPLFISHSGTLLLLRMDQIMVFRMAGDAEAGVYAAATRLSEMMYAAGPIVIMVFMPKLASAFAHNRSEYESKRGLLFGVLSVLGYGAILSWWIGGRWVVHLLYGDSFARVADVLAVHCMAVLPYLHGELRGTLLVIEKQSSEGAKAAMAGVVLNVLLNLWLIPSMGALGAAWATAVTYTLVWLVGSLVVPKLRAIGCQQMRSLLAPVWLWRERTGVAHLLHAEA